MIQKDIYNYLNFYKKLKYGQYEFIFLLIYLMICFFYYNFKTISLKFIYNCIYYL